MTDLLCVNFYFSVIQSFILSLFLQVQKFKKEIFSNHKLSDEETDEIRKIKKVSKVNKVYLLLSAIQVCRVEHSPTLVE